MALSIEPMAEAHLQKVTAIEKVSNGAPWSETSFRREIANPQARYFVALKDGAVVGYAGFWCLVDEAHVTNVAVAPECRGNGIGRQLMDRLIEEAKALGMSCATLEVRAGNAAAISLYEKLGFQNSGLRKNYYPDNREDAVIMWRYGL